MPVSPLKHPAGGCHFRETFIQPTSPASQTSSSQLATGTFEMPVLQSPGLVSQITANLHTSDQKSRLETPTYKARKENGQPVSLPSGSWLCPDSGEGQEKCREHDHY